MAWQWLQGPGPELRVPHRGHTPLHYAARNGHVEIAELLLSKGAELEAKSNEGPGP